MPLGFDLNNEITTFEDNELVFSVDESIPYEEYLNEASALLVESPSNIQDDETWERIKILVLCLPDLILKNTLKNSNTVYDTFISAFESEIERTDKDIMERNLDEFDHHKINLQLYAYLAFVSMSHMVNSIIELKGESSTSKEIAAKFKSTCNTFIKLLNSIDHLFSLTLSFIFQSTTEHSFFVSNVFLTAVNHAMEKPEIMKLDIINKLILTIICKAVKLQSQGQPVQNQIIQHLTYYSHLSEEMALIFSSLNEEFDNRALLEPTLRELSSKDLSIKMTASAKSVGEFIFMLTKHIPERMVSYIGQITSFFTNSPSLRGFVIESLGKLMKFISRSEENFKTYQEKLEVIFQIIDERLLDTYHQVRSRCLQVINELLISPTIKIKFINQRILWTSRAVRHLDDKASFVRKNALSLLSALIMTHPYGVDDSRLSWNKYWDDISKFTRELNNFKNGAVLRKLRSEELNSVGLEKYDSWGKHFFYKENELFESLKLHDSACINQENAEEENECEDSKEEYPEHIAELILKRKFCRDCLIFITLLHQSLDLSTELLNSKNKSDAISAMDYFVLAEAFGIENAKQGIKEMLHLIWKNGKNEEGTKIVEKLIECYTHIYLTPPENSTTEEADLYIAKSLIKLTKNCTMADLASLEKLVVELYNKKTTTQQSINYLWHTYISNDNEKLKKSSIIILSMLATADYEIVLPNITYLLNIGLNEKVEDWQLSKFSCMALRKTIPEKVPEQFQMPDFSTAIAKLKSLLLVYSEEGNWFSMAEEALNTLYIIDETADQTSSDILKSKAMSIFTNDEENSDTNRIAALSQFLFLLGHISLKTIVYLDQCEAKFKKKKTETEQKKTERDAELDLIGGTNEDDFTDAVQNIKERELLYGAKSLLAKFVPLVLEIISKPSQYQDDMLQRQATLCFAKFMCISPRFCEDNLLLYLELMEESVDPIIRSNMVLGLGDMAVSFNNIIDSKRNALYSRLQDKDLTVQRTCLMTVTFLILAGQVKVKGQLAQMAKLLVHEDSGIQDLCRLFFTELAGKDNAIYNGFIDMLSGLMSDRKFDAPSFKEVVKFVIPFIKKEKQRYLLITKIDMKLQKTDNEIEWTRLALCLREFLKREEVGNKVDNGSQQNPKSQFYSEINDRLQAGFKTFNLDKLQKTRQGIVENEKEAKRLENSIVAEGKEILKDGNKFVMNIIEQERKDKGKEKEKNIVEGEEKDDDKEKEKEKEAADREPKDEKYYVNRDQADNREKKVGRGKLEGEAEEESEDEQEEDDEQNEEDDEQNEEDESEEESEDEQEEDGDKENEEDEEVIEEKDSEPEQDYDEEEE